MKKNIKIILALLVLSIFNTWFAESNLVSDLDIVVETTTSTWEVKTLNSTIPSEEISYNYFYGQWCSHCAKVDKYLTWVDWYEKLGIIKKEIYFDDDNRQEMTDVAESMWLDSWTIGVPFLVIINDWIKSSLSWDQPIIDYFTLILWDVPPNNNKNIVLAILAVLAVLIPVFLIKLSNKN